MRASIILSAATALLLAGCVPQPDTNTAREGQGRFAGYNAYRPLPDDPPDVVQELAAAKADSEAAQAAMRMGDRAGAMQIAKKASAELNDAQKKRATMNYPKDLQLMRAIDAGQVPERPDMSRAAAQEMLGEFYENGLGIQKDYAAARFWYEKAISTQGDAFAVKMASAHLANLVGAGLGGPKDPARAEVLIHRAGGITQADLVAQEKEREAKLAAFMAALAATSGGPRKQEDTEKGPSTLTCHYAIRSAPSIAGMMGCPPWTP